MKDLRIKKIKRKKPVNLLVNGKRVLAYKGETVLSALVAAGCKSLKKSPVAREPRGALCGMGVCYECLVSINGVPRLRSCMIEVEDNMEIELDG